MDKVGTVARMWLRRTP